MATFSATELRRLRISNDVSRAALAVAIDRSPETIAAYEHGRAVPGANTLGVLAEMLGVNPGALFEAGAAEHLVDQAVAQGKPRHVGDPAVLARVGAVAARRQGTPDATT